MSTREDYPAGVPCWIDTSQPDPADAAGGMPPGAGAQYYIGRIDGRDVAAISSLPPAHPGGWRAAYSRVR